MNDQIIELTIEDLAERVGVPVRTVRYYVAEGLLPGPGSRGKAASYGEEHLLRLMLIRKLVERHVPLKEIGARLANLSTRELRALLAREASQEEKLRREASEPSPRRYLASLLETASAPPVADASYQMLRLRKPPETSKGTEWLRLEVAPGVEVHVRADAAARYGERLEEAIALLREVLRRFAR